MSKSISNKPVTRFNCTQRAIPLILGLCLLLSTCLSPIVLATDIPDETVAPPEEAVTQNHSFTPAGQGTVLDSIGNGGREFLTITTEHGNTFFLIIDRERGKDNVYFLTEVTEDNLLDFVTEPRKDEIIKEEAVPQPTPTEPHEKSPTKTDTDSPAEKNTKLLSISIGIILLIALLAGAGCFIYFKILKKEALNETLPEEYPDEEEEVLEDEDE